MGANPAVLRAAVLATELVVFLLVTAFTSYFLSHAAAWQHGQDDQPPARFPVLAFEGDRERPEPQNYFIVPWSEWHEVAAKRPAATLLLPEREATIQLGDGSEASFTVTDQVVELSWRKGSGEQKARYIARVGHIEPLFLRTLGTDTLLMGAAVGFLTGMFTGRALRRRWLGQPGTLVPPVR